MMSSLKSRVEPSKVAESRYALPGLMRGDSSRKT